jgi:hypothetical protein
LIRASDAFSEYRTDTQTLILLYSHPTDTTPSILIHSIHHPVRDLYIILSALLSPLSSRVRMQELSPLSSRARTQILGCSPWPSLLHGFSKKKHSATRLLHRRGRPPAAFSSMAAPHPRCFARSRSTPIHLARRGRGGRGGLHLRPHPPCAVGGKRRHALPQFPTQVGHGRRQRCVSSVSGVFIHIASLWFKCFSYFRWCMLQVFYTDVAKVDRDIAYVAMVIHVCCICFYLYV